MKRTDLIFAVIVSVLLLFVVGCKPGQIVSERLATKTKDSVVLELRDSLHAKQNELSLVSAKLERLRLESINLSNETHRHELYYDTYALPDSATGMYPLASEIITSNSSRLYKAVEDYEILLKEAEREINTLTTKNSNLQMHIESLTNEDYRLEEEPKWGLGMSFKLWVIGIVVVSLILMITKNKLTACR